MPLIHSKKPAAFSKNVSTEMHAGKPQKQAVAIAYSVKRKAEHKKRMDEGGKVSSSDDSSSSSSDQPTQADKPGTWAYKVKHAFDPSPAPSPEPTNKPVEAGFWADGGEVDSSDDDDNSDLTDVDTDMSHVPADSPLRINTEFDKYAKGGDVHATMPEQTPDDELHDLLSGELMNAIEKKDKKGIMQTIEALVTSMANRKKD